MTRAAARCCALLPQNHYVERLYKLYLYSAPTIFYGLWKVLYPLIDPKSREKVGCVRGSGLRGDQLPMRG